MNKNVNVPKIRFKEFTNDWEQRKFENIFDYERPDKYIVSSDEYSEMSKTPVLTANKAFILGYTDEENTYKNESVIFDDFTLDSKFVDFPYMVKSSAIKILTLKDKNNNNLRFNYELLSNHKFNVLGHARHYISVVQPEEILTTNKLEQERIANIMWNIDNLITLHQSKYDEYSKIKKIMLEKMFPKNGEKIPHWRFKEFTNDWEQRKLNEFSKYVTSNKTASDSIKEGKYNLYDANSIIGKVNDGIINEEYITIIKDGSGVGKVRRLPKSTAFIGTMGGILAKEANIDFIYCNLLKTDFVKEINGATIPHVYYSSYGNNNYYIPKISEQEKIGKIFKSLDNLITLHQKKLDKLNNVKKALLEKMFV